MTRLVPFLGCFFQLQAQNLDSRPTDIDPTFQFASNTPANPTINDLVLLPNGGIAVAGGPNIGFKILTSSGAQVYPDPESRIGNPCHSVALNSEGLVLEASERTSGTIHAQDGSRIHSLPYFNGTVKKILVQRGTDSIILAGISSDATMVPPTIYGLLRATRIGELDTTFNRYGSRNLNFTTAALTHDGRILGAYYTTNTTGQLAYAFGRWLSNGIRDTNYSSAWAAAAGPNARVTVIEPDLSGGFLAAVEFGENTKTTQLIPLSANGDAVISQLPLIAGSVHTLAFEDVQLDNEDCILIGGSFTYIGETPCKNFAALRRNGQPSWFFSPSEGPNGPINAVEPAPDGSILLGGAFTTVNGKPASGIVRLRGRAAGQTYLYWAQDRFGAFEKLGQAELVLRRSGQTNAELQVDVTLGDNQPRSFTFRPAQLELSVPVALTNDIYRQGPRAVELSVTTHLTNCVLISRAKASLVILDDETPGTLDPLYQSAISGRVNPIALQRDGKILVAHRVGDFPRLSRLHPDGSRDNSFQDASVGDSQIEPQRDGSIYVAWGGLVQSHGFYYGYRFLVRLNTNGVVDTTFSPVFPVLDTRIAPEAIFAVMPDGKIIVGDRWNKDIRGFNPDGSAASFHLRGTTQDLLPLSTNQLLVAGDHPPGADVFSVDRDGNPDNRFSVETDGSVRSIARHGDYLILGGTFNSIQGLATTNLARVRLATGAVDTNWKFDIDSQVIKVQKDSSGRVYVQGIFTRFNGQERAGLARLNPNGSLDTAFLPQMYFASDPASPLLPQSDGSVLVGAPVSAYPFNVEGLIRLEGDLRPQLDIRREGDQLIITGNASMKLEMSDDLATWITVRELTDQDRQHALNLPGQKHFFRLEKVAP